jgi:hypothetical protein
VLGRGTPTADAFDYAPNHIALSAEQLAVPGNTNMLLITDGMPTLHFGCHNPTGMLANVPTDELVALVDSAYARGVKTYIIGLPGSEEALPGLSMAAALGGTAPANCNPSVGTTNCHMDLTTAADMGVALQNALARTIASSSSCNVEIPTYLGDTTQATGMTRMVPLIRYSNGTTVLLGRATTTESECSEGYRITDSTRIELCSSTCAALYADSAASIQLSFGCSAADLRAIGVK